MPTPLLLKDQMSYWPTQHHSLSTPPPGLFRPGVSANRSSAISTSLSINNAALSKKFLFRTRDKLSFYNGVTAPSGPGPPHYRGFTITLRHTTLGRTPLEEWSARRGDLYLTTHNSHKRQTSMPPAGFESGIPASEWPQIYALDRAANGIGEKSTIRYLNWF
jgi:hypothetical protein